MSEPIVLASASRARAELLARAGIAAEIVPAAIDEEETKRAFRAAGAAAGDCAVALAELKAIAVSRRRPGRLVIGADQLLVAGETWFDKPETRAAARAQLQALRGRAHRLETAAVAVRDGARLWHALARPRLTMRALPDATLDAYLDSAGSAVLASVGAYQIEGPGVQLFSAIEGDYFAILGLPLLELLGFLRAHGIGLG